MGMHDRTDGPSTMSKAIVREVTLKGWALRLPTLPSGTLHKMMCRTQQ